MTKFSKRQIAFVQILITAVLWGTTYVLVQLGIQDIGPLMLAGLRYTAAGLILLPFVIKKGIPILDYRNSYWKLALLGILAFSLGNGFIGLSLKSIPSTTVALLGNLSTPTVLIVGILWLKENPKPIQLLGVFIALIGIIIYFSPSPISFDDPGIIFVIGSIVSFAGYALLSRQIARSGKMPFLLQTTVPFLVGGVSLLIAALILEDTPVINLKTAVIVAWTAIFNSVIGYTLYNKSIQVLSAFEVNIVQKLAPFSTAFFSWILLDATITASQLISMSIVFMGIYLVLKGTNSRAPKQEKH